MIKKVPLLIISIAAIAVVAGSVVGVLALTNGFGVVSTESEASQTPDKDSKDNKPEYADPSKQESQTTPDLSKDLGACTILSRESIVAATQQRVATVGAAVNRGYASESDGDGSQGCTYAFSDVDALNDRLGVTVTTFSTNERLAASKSAYTNEEKVDGIGDAAYFMSVSTESSAGTPAQNSYSLSIFKGSKLYVITIAQPTDSDAFTRSTAREAIVEIASTAKF